MYEKKPLHPNKGREDYVLSSPAVPPTLVPKHSLHSILNAEHGLFNKYYLLFKQATQRRVHSLPG